MTKDIIKKMLTGKMKKVLIIQMKVFMKKTVDSKKLNSLGAMMNI